MLVGQEVLRTHFETLHLENDFPKLMILVGPKGQGKRTLALYVANMIGDVYVPTNLKVDDVREMISDSQTLHKPRAYIVANADDMTTQAQNAILKFAEEPTTNAYIIMTTTHEEHILPTIKSRGGVYRLQPYTQDELRAFTDNELILSICSNPGQVKKALESDFERLVENVDKVVDNINRVSVANTFNIPKYFDGIDIDLVFSVFMWAYLKRLKNQVRQHGKSFIIRQINVIYKYKRLMENKSINKQNALEMMFVELREATK